MVLHAPLARHGSAVYETATELQAWVLAQPPKTPVREGDVAKRWSVSRPTAKSAITILVNDGLLRQEPNRPAYIPKLTSEDVRDLFGARIPLELEITRRAAKQRHAPQQAAFQVYAISQMIGNELTHEFVAADLGFHLALLDSVDSPRLTRLYRAIQGEMHLTMVQSRQVLGGPTVSKQHGHILEAIRQGNLDEAVKAMSDHLEGACELIAEKLEKLKNS